MLRAGEQEQEKMILPQQDYVGNRSLLAMLNATQERITSTQETRTKTHNIIGDDNMSLQRFHRQPAITSGKQTMRSSRQRRDSLRSPAEK
jgi:hypothetical protein